MQKRLGCKKVRGQSEATRAKTNILNVNEQIMFLMNEYLNIL